MKKRKQKQNLEHSLEKVYVWIEGALNWEYKNNEYILSYLDRREKILLKSKDKIKMVASAVFCKYNTI